MISPQARDETNRKDVAASKDIILLMQKGFKANILGQKINKIKGA